MLKANLTMRVLKDPPFGRACKSGHVAPEGVRFLRVSGEALAEKFWGDYCEDCVSTANKRKEVLKKQGHFKKVNPSPVITLDFGDVEELVNFDPDFYN